VTAIGEVNERAPNERSATDGRVPPSKAVVERLAPEAADDLGLAPQRSHAGGAGADPPAQNDPSLGGIAVVDPREGLNSREKMRC
jgi:hypothetical protein